jgi:hypothetical protein
MERVVIIVPSQGDDTGSFLSVAKMLRAHFYHHATIVRTKVAKTTGASSDASPSVTLTKLDGTAFSWEASRHLTRVLTVSHAFSGAGQNLTYGDSTFGDRGGSQPWGSKDDDGTLSPEGQSFWKSVGDSLRPHGKIIMLGCFMGFGAYGASVAKAAHRIVYASTDLFGAGDTHTALKYVGAIEKGKVLPPLKSFEP